MEPTMYDGTSLEAAGIPLTPKMVKYSNAVDQNGVTVTKNLLKKSLSYESLLDIMREQNRIETIERYDWINLPPGITADIIERLLYYRGKGVAYFNDKVGKFQFLPFALNNTIDEYGRYTRCNTLPFTGVDTDYNEGKGKKKTLNLIYEDLELVYDLPYDMDMYKKILNGKPVGIILNDSTLGISQQPVIRYNYVTPIIRMMAELIQIIHTAMFGAADHSLLQIENEGELASIYQQIEAINFDILKGSRFTPVMGKFPITPIKTSNTADLEGLFGTFNSLTNFLKSITGIANAGVFDKKAHLLQEEQRLNGSNSDDIYYNGLRMRQEFCLLFQAYYQYPIWCESKRGLTEAQVENALEGQQVDPSDTTNQQSTGGIQNASD